MNIFIRLLRLPLVAKALPLPVRIVSIAVSGLLVNKVVNNKILNASNQAALPSVSDEVVHESLQLHDFDFFRMVKRLFITDNQTVTTDFFIKAVRWLYKTFLNSTTSFFTGRKPFDTGPQNCLGFAPKAAIFTQPGPEPDDDVFLIVINDTTIMGATALMVILIKVVGAYIVYKLAIYMARKFTSYIVYIFDIKTTTRKSVKLRKRPTKTFNYKDFI